MSNNVVPLTNARRKAKKQDKRKATTMCKSGFHRWEVWKDKQFDVKRGKLITVFRCSRCQKEKVELC